MFVVMISFDDIPEIYIVKNVTDLEKKLMDMHLSFRMRCSYSATNIEIK